MKSLMHVITNHPALRLTSKKRTVLPFFTPPSHAQTRLVEDIGVEPMTLSLQS